MAEKGDGSIGRRWGGLINGGPKSELHTPATHAQSLGTGREKEPITLDRLMARTQTPIPQGGGDKCPGFPDSDSKTCSEGPSERFCWEGHWGEGSEV